MEWNKELLAKRPFTLDYVTGFCGLALALFPLILNGMENRQEMKIFVIVGLVVAAISAYSTINKMISPWLDSVYFLAGLMILLTLEGYELNQLTPYTWLYGTLGLAITFASGYNLFFSKTRSDYYA